MLNIISYLGSSLLNAGVARKELWDTMLEGEQKLELPEMEEELVSCS